MTLFWILAGLAGATVLERILGGEQVLVSTGPAGAGAASGSMRSDTWSHNRFGMYVRNRTIPVNPNTARQIAVRAALASMTTRWAQTLTAPQRAAWNLYGASVVMKNKIGQDVLLTGFNHYLRSNIIRQVSTEGPVDAGPTVFELPAQDPTITLAISEATQNKTVAFDDGLPWATEDGAYMYLFDGQPQNAQRNFFAGPWKGVQEVAGIDPGGAATPVVAAINYVCTQGQRVWMYARISRADGRLSEPFQADCLVGA